MFGDEDYVGFYVVEELTNIADFRRDRPDVCGNDDWQVLAQLFRDE